MVLDVEQEGAALVPAPGEHVERRLPPRNDRLRLPHPGHYQVTLIPKIGPLGGVRRSKSFLDADSESGSVSKKLL